jgi:Caspase domain
MKIRATLIVPLITIVAVFYPGSFQRSHLEGRSLDQERQLKQLDSVQTLPAKGKRWALVIGVDQYADTQITTLGGASNDAKSIAGALVRYAGFAAEQVTLLASDQPAERQPTRGNILRRLSNMAAVVPKDGLLLISFAGHGIERSGQAFLLPSDAQVANDVELLEQTAINVTQMKERIRKTGVGQVIMILDACRNDPVGRGEAGNPLTEAYTRGFDFDVRNREVTAFATLYATAVGQRAYEYKEKHQGYFTWELVQGLKGAAANEKGEVTLSLLVRYLQQHVPTHVLADLGAGKDQRPFAVIAGYRADDLVIAITKPASSTATNGSTGTSSSVDSLAIELSFWETIKNSSDPEDFQSYLRKYPNGQFAELARRRAGLATGSGETTAASSFPVFGRWVGQWSSTRGQSGTSTLNIVEERGGVIKGDEDGWKMVNGHRAANVLSWEYQNIDQCRDYQVTLTIHDDQTTATYRYAVTDHCQAPPSYNGSGVYKKQSAPANSSKGAANSAASNGGRTTRPSPCFDEDKGAGILQRELHYGWAQQQDAATLGKNLSDKADLLFRCQGMNDDTLSAAFADISIVIAKAVPDANCFGGDSGVVGTNWSGHKNAFTTATNRRARLLDNLKWKMAAALNCLDRSKQTALFADISVLIANAPFRTLR